MNSIGGVCLNLDFMSTFHKDFRLVCFSFAIWTFLCVLSNMRRHLTAEEAARAVGMLEAGHSQRQVAGQFNVTQNVISKLRNRYNQTGTVQERQRSGRPRCTTAREDRYLGLIARRQSRSRALLGLMLTSDKQPDEGFLHKQSETDSTHQIYVLADQQ